ncbi:rod shape-determining protein RodA [Bacteroidota bacterium]
MRDRKSIFNHVDWLIVILYLLMIFFGWLNIYAAEYTQEYSSIFSLNQNYGKQFIWIASSILLLLAILMIDAKFFISFSYLFYAISIISLITVLLVGNEIGGSKSWFQFGFVSIQPSEFAKFSASLALAAFLSSLNIQIHKFKTQLRYIAIIIVPAVLIFLQHDLGSALVFISFTLVLYRVGMSENILLLGLMAIFLFIITLLINKFIVIGSIAGIMLLLYFLIKKSMKNILILVGIFLITSTFVYSVDYAFENVLKPHQKTRINVLLGKEKDLKGAGYNINQSKIAIGSGGLYGKGFLNGTQTKFDFVPEQSTDFIFCTVGEEWGFLGSIIVIGLFIGLLSRLIIIAERQRSSFSRIYGYCVVSILFFHFLINIGMTIGLFPVIGIPLPFFSYGGSSLWSFTILLFIFVKLDSSRYTLI